MKMKKKNNKTKKVIHINIFRKKFIFLYIKINNLIVFIILWKNIHFQKIRKKIEKITLNYIKKSVQISLLQKISIL